MRLERAGSPSNGSPRPVVHAPPPGLEAQTELARLFAEAYTRLHGPMIDCAEAQNLDRESARDAAAEAAANVWYRWPQLAPAQRTDAYFFGALRNAVMDVYRDRKDHVGLEESEAELERQAALAMETITRTDTAADVLDLALAVMPPRRREVLLLVKESDFTYPEAAEALGLSVGTINTHMRLATRDLKTAFTRAGFRIAADDVDLLLKPTRGAAHD